MRTRTTIRWPQMMTWIVSGLGRSIIWFRSIRRQVIYSWDWLHFLLASLIKRIQRALSERTLRMRWACWKGLLQDIDESMSGPSVSLWDCGELAIARKVSSSSYHQFFLSIRRNSTFFVTNKCSRQFALSLNSWMILPSCTRYVIDFVYFYLLHRVPLSCGIYTLVGIWLCGAYCCVSFESGGGSAVLGISLLKSCNFRYLSSTMDGGTVESMNICISQSIVSASKVPRLFYCRFYR